MQKLLNVMGIMVTLVVVVIVIANAGAHIFTKPSAVFIQTKNPDDTTKTIRIPMVEDSSGEYLTAKMPARSSEKVIQVGSGVFVGSSGTFYVSKKLIAMMKE